ARGEQISGWRTWVHGVDQVVEEDSRRERVLLAARFAAAEASGTAHTTITATTAAARSATAATAARAAATGSTGRLAETGAALLPIAALTLIRPRDLFAEAPGTADASVNIKPAEPFTEVGGDHSHAGRGIDDEIANSGRRKARREVASQLLSAGRTAEARRG